MLTRLYVDNYRCLVNFEFKPKQVQLLIGGNGTGKTTVFEVLDVLRRFISGDLLPPANVTRTRWLSDPKQKFELEIAADGGIYRYALTAGDLDTDRNPRVHSETLDFDGMPLLQTTADNFTLWQNGAKAVTGSRDVYRSVLHNAPPNLTKIISFRGWLRNLRWLQTSPWRDLPEQLARTSPQSRTKLAATLRPLIPGLKAVGPVDPGNDPETVRATLRAPGGVLIHLGLDELSEGQRTLITLYLHLQELTPGGLVLLDEPENFLSLPEVQPWLMKAVTAVEDAEGQMIVASHHPELINQLATDALVFERPGSGATHLSPFPSDLPVLDPAVAFAQRGRLDG